MRCISIATLEKKGKEREEGMINKSIEKNSLAGRSVIDDIELLSAMEKRFRVSPSAANIT
jgi:hypothetical protein